jgi:ankyrin repeat protein
MLKFTMRSQKKEVTAEESSMPSQSTSEDPKMVVSYPANCLVDSLRLHGASHDIRQRRISLERIGTKNERRRQSLPLMPSYLTLNLTKKSSLKKKSTNEGPRKGVSFPLGIMMQQAVTDGDMQGIKQLIDTHGSNAVEEREPNGLPPVMRAIFEGQITSLKFLLDTGADVASRDPESWTALHVAAAMDDFEAAEMVLRTAGKQQDMTSSRNVDGERPIDLAESLEMAGLLLHADLQIDPPHSTESSDDSMSNEREVMQLVVDHFEKHSNCRALDDILKQNTCYSSLLHLAATKNFPHLASYVSKHRLSSMETRDKNGWTPLHTAAYYNSLDVAILLSQNGANMHTLTRSFEKAVDLTDHQLIQALLEAQPAYLSTI